MKTLTNKTVIVAGGGSGIGLGIARELSQAGCQVTITGRRPAVLEEAAKSVPENPPSTFACDISDRDSVAALFEKHGTPDILINCAGVNIVNRALNVLSPEDFDRLMAINCTGFFNLLHAALPTMRERKDGLIFSISSIAGKRPYTVAGAAYSASKFAATALGTATGDEERENGIRVTNIYPGEVNTPILENRPVKISDEQKAQMVHPEDIGKMVLPIAQLPAHVHVPELIIKPLYQEYL